MSLKIQSEVFLQAFNTLGVASIAEYFASCESVSDIQLCLNWAQKKQIPVHILGGGSNVLLAEHIRGLVIKPELFGKTIQVDDSCSLVTAAAGENWHQFVMWCCENGAYGIENLALIPGTVGAAPVQNIGAYGVELMQYVESVSALNTHTGDLETLSREDCQFSYRDSLFKTEQGAHYIITELVLRLNRAFVAQLNYSGLDTFNTEQTAFARELALSIAALRQSKLPDPKDIPNAGSFFKNPVVDESQCAQLIAKYPDMPSYPAAAQKKKIPAAWLIDRLGWKNKIINDVGVHEKQALVVVNPKHKSRSDILEFANAIQDDVKREFGIELEIEPRQVQ